MSKNIPLFTSAQIHKCTLFLLYMSDELQFCTACRKPIAFLPAVHYTRDNLVHLDDVHGVGP